MYLIGLFVSIFVYLGRAGLFRVKEQPGVNRYQFVFTNLGWYLMTLVKAFTWPVVLLTWLAQGLPASRWQAVTDLNGRPARAIIRK